MRYWFTCAVLWLGIALPSRAQLAADVSDVDLNVIPASVQVQGKDRVQTFTSERFGKDSWDGLALQGMAPMDRLEGWVTFTYRDGTTSDELPLYIVRSVTDGGFLAAYRGSSVQDATSASLRFTVSAEGDPVIVAYAGLFSDESPEEVRQHDGDSHGRPSLVVPPVLITRAQWNASPFQGTPSPLARGNYTRMSWHHAAGFGAYTREQGIAQVKAIQTFHQNGRGWSDIGYQFLFDQEGRLYQGRPFMDASTSLVEEPSLALGAHVGGANTGNIGMCFLGCYHPPETAYACNDEASPAQIDSLVTLVAFLSDTYSIPTSQLFGHRDQGSTACPGDNNYALIGEVRAAAQDLKATGNQPLAKVQFSGSADKEGVVTLTWEILDAYDLDRVEVVRLDDDGETVLKEQPGIDPGFYLDTEPDGTETVYYYLYGYSTSGRRMRMGVVDVTFELGIRDALSTFFPNPIVTGQARAKYYLARDARITIKVYDALGRVQATPYDGFASGEQWHDLRINVDGMRSGLYFVRMQVESFAGVTFDETRTFSIVR